MDSRIKQNGARLGNFILFVSNWLPYRAYVRQQRTVKALSNHMPMKSAHHTTQ